MNTLADKAKEALEGATPGPWEVKYSRGTTQLQTPDGVTMCDETYYPWVPDNEADWQLFALAPDLACAYLEVLEELQEARLSELAALRQAREAYDAQKKAEAERDRLTRALVAARADLHEIEADDMSTFEAIDAINAALKQEGEE